LEHVNDRIMNFKYLDVYRDACELDQQVFLVSKSFPREEMTALTERMRCAARSVGAAIAEAWSKRRYHAHFVCKLTDADGALQETRHWLDRANACGYLPVEVKSDLDGRCNRAEARLAQLIANPPIVSATTSLLPGNAPATPRSSTVAAVGR
jgi:four helix bundle protein